MKYPTLLALALLALAGQENAQVDALRHAKAAVLAGTVYRIDPALLISLAWEESRARADVVSPGGACGPTQVIPRFIPGVSCDDLQDVEMGYLVGAMVLTRWKEHCKAPDPLACYNGGNEPGGRSAAYAKRVRLRAKWLGAWIQTADSITK